MDIEKRADKIALDAIKYFLKYGLRLPPAGEKEKKYDACIASLVKLFQNELNPTALARFAAVMTYRANLSEQDLNIYKEMCEGDWSGIKLARSGSVGNASEAKEALQKLENTEFGRIARAVDYGRIIERKVKASAASKKGKEKILEIQSFAISLYIKGTSTWKNPSQARHSLWPQVHAKSVELGRPMTVSQGPVTLYKWLLDYEKSVRSTS